ncbi:D-alanyl-lipoteichoic acid biosynthesis protein DltD [Clostridium sp.]|uniref:D-alanyl-lipoteichoic acid biosynthesis protein DltD n=1 Tax=Clostridium sp. TaxID=1506 RepID=UPI002FCC3E6C
MKKLIYLIIPVIIGGIFALGLNAFLDYKINILLSQKNLVPTMGQYASDEKDYGTILNNHFLENKDIMMIGASDLIHVTKQNAPHYFNTNRSENKVFTVGRTFTQELQDSMILGSTNTNIKDKKIVLLVALSWFVYPDGIGPNQFKTRFSPVQFYTFLNNPEISQENKDKLTERITNLLKTSDEYKPERLYAKLYAEDTFMATVKKVALYPYYKFREAEVKLKEKGLLYKKLRTLKNKSHKEEKLGKPINWKKEYKIAEEDAKKKVGDNPYGVYQDYYDETLAPKLKELKNKYAGVDLLKCKELNDYDYFLNICKDLGIEPTVVIVPGLPKYYDYTGVSQEQRTQLYNKIEGLAKEKGFDVINTGDKAGDPYYMRDVMHLGTKGWVDVSEQLYKKYNQEQVFNK